MLINIAGGNDLSLHEINEVTDVITHKVDTDANIKKVFAEIAGIETDDGVVYDTDSDRTELPG